MRSSLNRELPIREQSTREYEIGLNATRRPEMASESHQAIVGATKALLYCIVMGNGSLTEE
jgi:hypothetical protein